MSQLEYAPMEELGNILIHAFSHSIEDVAYLIPFLFITYVAMEWLEHRTAGKTQEVIQHAGAAGPIAGALLGAVPQCGFSAAAATLYAGRVVTLGTLFAVFLSTSDEMLPIFLAEQVPLETIAKILLAKILIGMVMGFVVDTVLRLSRKDKQNLRIHELCKQDKCRCANNCSTCEKNPELVYQHHDDCPSACTHEHHDHDHENDHNHGWGPILKSTLIHTVQVGIFVLLITLVLNMALEVVGEESLATFLSANPLVSVLASSLVGLVPNCAASVVIAQLYIEGMLSAGAMMGGLLVSAGVGLLVLLRSNRPVKQSVLIVCLMYVIGVAWGLAIDALGVAF